MQTSNKITFLAATGLLAWMGIAAISSMAEDSSTMDELAHLPAGYSYLTQQDMRINPEHPPLIKDLAALPLLFISGINFPSDVKAWTEDLNGQWDFGTALFYKSGNDADKMLFWGRIPMIIVMLLLGLILFFWIRQLWGDNAALLTLFLYSFSPTFLAHGRLVTTDVGAALGVVLATAFFLNFLQNPSLKNIILAGIALGIAELIKFNLVLLYPFLGLTIIFWTLVKIGRQKIKNFFLYCVKFAAIIAVAWLLIWPVYAFHVQNLPAEKQIKYVEVFTQGHPAGKALIPFTLFLSQHELLRPWGYYMLGVDMATQRASGGNTTYFMGEVSAAGWLSYFPLIYVIKEPLALFLLIIFALVYMAVAIKRPPWQESPKRLKSWLAGHFTQFAMLLWIAIYWAASLASNLNIGIRHLLPTFPFVYALVAWATMQWVPTGGRFKKFSFAFVVLILLWQAITVIKVYPSFLSYFNELAGGPTGGSSYVVDSNLDWGQDLKRLAKFVKQNNIDKIKIAYFGGGIPKYYLGGKAESFKWEEPQKGWVAISATLLRGGQSVPAPGFNESTSHFYWLYPYQPVTVIGNSIFVYNIL
ncbi:MAG: hypothetical protein A2667_03155 [Candidatus Wildermuthbacteria bacterium RIFCSPHIGHO2_01_FULL_47_27]|uniref:Glycosyltransferase RgtA/B/C/D-like domain-containing protein n=1 Tax=Candidatus Wildermuthbacteria bacterium RIFCSPLOWO2_01_FULL_48_35 TaxID=1802463 RepID=A0A1G2RM08_9BACT|nr:MAG: hypothetical protein A2667_03155 [Candidatus Wildermuthbacteria bacterium RIFCSPHIGHO2_01_FULL_47_27]OHA73857.1 MAG: hypothetical protein A3A32_02990 [Candidatus Wildermuthbacteria bacterium RIFCSPLOWO2_01_FULL_48_35]OHA76542.1 MAG: hypothetical protein A3I38_03670 [Candidatus Wildermuthbacteria bacterium RIFCSPLOWO2_02_FULL_47_10]